MTQNHHASENKSLVARLHCRGHALKTSEDTIMPFSYQRPAKGLGEIRLELRRNEASSLNPNIKATPKLPKERKMYYA